MLACSTIGGDEMNVCLDLQLLGVETVRSHCIILLRVSRLGAT